MYLGGSSFCKEVSIGRKPTPNASLCLGGFFCLQGDGHRAKADVQCTFAISSRIWSAALSVCLSSVPLPFLLSSFRGVGAGLFCFALAARCSMGRRGARLIGPFECTHAPPFVSQSQGRSGYRVHARREEGGRCLGRVHAVNASVMFLVAPLLRHPLCLHVSFCILIPPPLLPPSSRGHAS